MYLKASIFLCCLSSSVALAKAPLVLLSIDGFAQRYITQYKPKTLMKLIEQGTSAKALLPVYPSKTFPNHLSIITGVYPINHGIVHNAFYHRKIEQVYKLGDGKNDQRWLTAEPLWYINEMQGNKSAVYFWPESETPINNQTPSYYFPYKHSTPNKQRLDQIISWLRLPAVERPNFIAGYFASIDDAGHKYGENSPQLITAIHELDDLLANFVAQINQEFNGQVNIVIVSDHGMTKIEKHHVIDWEENIVGNVKAINGSTQLYLYSDNEAELTQSINLFKSKQSNTSDPSYRLYIYEDYPAYWHFNRQNSVIPNAIVEASPSYIFRSKKHYDTAETHGYDPKFNRDIDAIFIATGPDFSTDKQVEPFENIHVLPIISRALGLKDVENIDGKYNIASKIVN